ncbi:MAG: S-layer homology domain-containing protein [Acidobacteriaceae bacterium]|jgi:tetratricopeptide (TPR) repeat protein|nr:S-layer homology domain-containing protein [Acidobacteriaceae bacterium]
MRVFVRLLAVLVFLVVASACAPARVAPPTVTAPRFPEFVEPLIPGDLSSHPGVAAQHRAWQFLQAGDLRSADRELTTLLKTDAAFYPADTALGYVDLARKDNRQALEHFDRVLGRAADYVPALVGKGHALMALNRDRDALESFEAAFAIDGTLGDVSRQIDVLKLRVVQQELASARQAVRAGKSDEAIRAYQHAIESSPESAFLYRELAAIEHTSGNDDAALDHFRQANALEPDATTLVAMADLLSARGEIEPALKAYRDALALERDPAVEDKIAALEERAQLARLPAEYRAIETAAQITRADLAALIGQRLSGLLGVTAARDVGVITDIRGHWAEPWILAVVRAGVMDPLPNHTFQPRGVIRRVEFAQAMRPLLAKVAVVAPEQARRWQGARGRFTDVSTSHVAYTAASVATASGVMEMTDNAFQPTRPVSGAEAIAALDRLAALAPQAVAATPR